MTVVSVTLWDDFSIANGRQTILQPDQGNTQLMKIPWHLMKGCSCSTLNLQRFLETLCSFMKGLFNNIYHVIPHCYVAVTYE